MYCDICYTIIKDSDNYKIFEIPPEDDFIRVCNECNEEQL